MTVQLQLSPFSTIAQSCPAHQTSPTSNPSHTCLCPWVLYTCSLIAPFPFFQLLFLFLLPSRYCQFIIYFHVSSSILYTCWFCWWGSIYRWDHMVFVFHCLLISLSIILSRSMEAIAKGKSSSIFSDAWYSIVKMYTLFWSTHLLMDT